MSKPLQPLYRIVDSLLALKDELEGKTHDASLRECLFKINSCLYEKYPITEQPYLVEKLTVNTTISKFNPNYDQTAECVCGHPYNRHFDSWENNDPVGCKYCECFEFIPR